MSIYIIDILRINDLKIDDQLSILRSSIDTVTKKSNLCDKSMSAGKGGEVIFNPRIFYIADFGPLYRALNREFRGKIAI